MSKDDSKSSTPVDQLEKEMIAQLEQEMIDRLAAAAKEATEREKIAYANGLAAGKKAAPSKKLTPLAVFVDMLEKAGYKQNTSSGFLSPKSFSVKTGHSINAWADGVHYFLAGLTRVTVGEGTGRAGFLASFDFNDEGNLVIHGCYE
jgi:hypothetical protein